MLNGYIHGDSPEDFTSACTFDVKEIVHLKNKYELIKNFFSFSFYGKYEIKNRYFFSVNFDFFSNTNFREVERVFYLEKDELVSKGSEKIGILSLCFGLGKYWVRNNFRLSSCINIGLIWNRENAMNLWNYKYQYDADPIAYLQKPVVKYDKEHDVFVMLDGRGTFTEFFPFNPMTWCHGDILVKLEIVNIQYKNFYINWTWQRGIMDTIKIIKQYKEGGMIGWLRLLPSTMSIGIGWSYSFGKDHSDFNVFYDDLKILKNKEVS